MSSVWYSGVAGNEFFITPPMVSNPSDKGVTSNSSTSGSPAKIPALLRTHCYHFIGVDILGFFTN